MKNKTVLIVGASGGIGGCTAKRLIAEGANVYNGSRTVSGLIGVKDYLLDVEKRETIEKAVEEIARDAGGIDALVYSAGTSMAAPFEYTREEDYRRLFEVNFFGLAAFVQAVVPHMKKGGGRIVAVSSMGGSFPIVYDAFYSASKAAVDMLIKELNTELNPFNIYLTSVAPGGTATPFSFKRLIYDEESAGEYNGSMLMAADSLINMEQGGDSPELVAKQIVSILKSGKPPVYSPSGMKNKALSAAKRLLPDPLEEYINERLYIKNRLASHDDEQ